MADEGALVVAADVGGTKTDVGLFAVAAEPQLLRHELYRSTEHAGLEEVLREFLAGQAVAAAAVAAAGPVRHGEIHTTNLPWRISADALSAELGGAQVTLLNDLAAAAHGVLALGDGAFHVINAGVAEPSANRAVLAPGTGLGQSILVWGGRDFVVSATEGGHVGFAPRDREQIALLEFLSHRVASVSYEHVLSGPGLANVFDFVTGELKVPVAAAVAAKLQRGDRGAAIGEAALSGNCQASRRSVEIFFRVLAARAGDLALTVLATGGVDIGGGIVPKLLPLLDPARFRRDFAGTGPFAELLAQIPLRVVLEAHVALIGAAAVAARQLVGESRA